MITKTINIGGVECKMKASALIPKLYRSAYRKDIIRDMQKLQKEFETQERRKKALKREAERKGRKFDEQDFESNMSIESLEIFENVAYLFHKHGDPSQPNNINDWLDQFDMFNIYEVLPQIIELWGVNTEQLSVQKNGPAK